MNIHLLLQFEIAFSFVSFVHSRVNCYCNLNEKFLDSHNYYREKHQVYPLSLDEQLIHEAHQRARYLARNSYSIDAVNGRGQPTGENIWHDYSPDAFDYNKDAPVDYWYNEIKYYDFEYPGPTDRATDFTQLVWKSTERLGCAVCKNRYSIFVVCKYSPKGNVANEFDINVFPIEPADPLIYVPFVATFFLIIWLCVIALIQQPVRRRLRTRIWPAF